MTAAASAATGGRVRLALEPREGDADAEGAAEAELEPECEADDEVETDAALEPEATAVPDTRGTLVVVAVERGVVAPPVAGAPGTVVSEVVKVTALESVGWGRSAGAELVLPELGSGPTGWIEKVPSPAERESEGDPSVAPASATPSVAVAVGAVPAA